MASDYHNLNEYGKTDFVRFVSEQMDQLASNLKTNIYNILKSNSLHALNNQTHELKIEWLEDGIRKEFIKENRTS